MNSNLAHPLLLDFTESTLHVLCGDAGLDLPLERDSSGNITPATVELAVNGLRGFIQSIPTRGRRILCNVPARGVSVRRITLPAERNGDTAGLLSLQLEAQLPVPPAELAWGYQPVGQPQTRDGNGGGRLQEFLVVAVRKNFLEPYAHICRTAGLDPAFTVGALNRTILLGTRPNSWMFAEIGASRAELTTGDAPGPTAVRVVSSNPRELAPLFHVSPDQKNCVAGKSELLPNLRSETPLVYETPALASGPGRSSANLGTLVMLESGPAPVLLGVEHAAPAQEPRGNQWVWPIAASLLLLLSLALRYLDSGIHKGRVKRQLSELAAYKATLPRIDTELAFLTYMKTNQPPYLEAVAAVANAAPPGMRIDNLALARHGELSLRGSVGDLQAPEKFRTKLIESGFFSRVVLEEQTPVENNQKMNFRMSAMVKPDGERKPLVLPLPKPASTNAAPAVPTPPKKSAPPQFTKIEP